MFQLYALFVENVFIFPLEYFKNNLVYTLPLEGSLNPVYYYYYYFLKQCVNKKGTKGFIAQQFLGVNSVVYVMK